IIDSLLKRVKKPVSNNHLISLDRKDDFIVAFFYNSESNKFNKIISNYLVLATGGYGSLFSYNDNLNFATGDGLILAKKIVANLKGMSTVMVHPWSINNGRSILVGEIVSLCK